MAITKLIWLLICVPEVVLSVAVHLSYGLLIFVSALLNDASSTFFSHSPDTHQTKTVVSRFITDSAAAAAAAASKAAIPSTPRSAHYGQLFQGHQDAPIVLVHGLFGFGEGKLAGLSYWAGAEQKDNQVLVPDLGSLTSMHDRARHLFYYLKGGTVDYGAEHSARFCHARYGPTYVEGNYPAWDEDHPIHLVAHSSGGQIARVFHQMLADKVFEGHSNTSGDWILSLTSLSGTLNGSTRTYIDGIRSRDGRSIERISLLQFLRVSVSLYEWLDIRALKNYYSFGFDHYHLGWHESGLKGLASLMLNKAGPFATGDWILPDLSIQGAMEINRTLRTHRNTYYFSYATKRTRKFLGQTIPSNVFDIHPALVFRTWQMCRWRLPSQEKPPYAEYRDEDWQDNDGALNTFSMVYPRLPEVHPHCYVQEENVQQGHRMKPGIWYYTIIEGDHVTFVINRERAGIRFDVLYDGIFQRCRKHLRKKEMEKNEQHTIYQCGCMDSCACNKFSKLCIENSD